MIRFGATHHLHHYTTINLLVATLFGLVLIIECFAFFLLLCKGMESLHKQGIGGHEQVQQGLLVYRALRTD